MSLKYYNGKNKIALFRTKSFAFDILCASSVIKNTLVKCSSEPKIIWSVTFLNSVTKVNFN